MTPTHTEYINAAKTIVRYRDFELISPSSGEHNNNINNFDTQAHKV